MTTVVVPGGTGGVGEETSARVEHAADWLGTAGWAAKGIVYLLLAMVAGQLAMGDTDDDRADKQGALHKLAEQPLGEAMLIAVVVGLIAFVAYRLLSVVVLDRATGRTRVAHVAVRLGSAAAYALVAVQGIQVLVHGDDPGADDPAKSWSARALDSGIGTVALIAVALGFFAFAGYQTYKGVTQKFMRKLDDPGGDLVSNRLVARVGTVGIVARGVVAALIGIFLVIAVVRHDPEEAESLDGALHALLERPAGAPMLAAVAVGLAAYGAFSLVSAQARRHEDG